MSLPIGAPQTLFAALALALAAMTLAPVASAEPRPHIRQGEPPPTAAPGAKTKVRAKAKPKAASPRAAKTGSKAGTKAGTKSASRSKGKAARASVVAKEKERPVALPPPRGKIAVLAFDGDGAAPIRRQVVSVLRAKGLTVTTSLRPVDSAEQYRDMAAALGLIAYVDGEVSTDGDEGSATVQIRSGVTGLRIASATFSGDRRQLSAIIGKELWERVATDLSRACIDAAKPRKPAHAPMRIEAGTPLEDKPAEPAPGDEDTEGTLLRRTPGGAGGAGQKRNVSIGPGASA